MDQMGGGSSSRPARLLIPPILHVDLIHRRIILHIAQKHIDLDYILNRGAGCFEHVGEVLDALVLFFLRGLSESVLDRA